MKAHTYLMGDRTSHAYLPLENNEFFQEMKCHYSNGLRQYTHRHMLQTCAWNHSDVASLARCYLVVIDILKRTNVCWAEEKKVRTARSARWLASRTPIFAWSSRLNHYMDLESIQEFQWSCSGWFQESYWLSSRSYVRGDRNAAWDYWIDTQRRYWPHHELWWIYHGWEATSNQRKRSYGV